MKLFLFVLKTEFKIPPASVDITNNILSLCLYNISFW